MVYDLYDSIFDAENFQYSIQDLKDEVNKKIIEVSPRFQSSVIFIIIPQYISNTKPLAFYIWILL